MGRMNTANIFFYSVLLPPCRRRRFRRERLIFHFDGFPTINKTTLFHRRSYYMEVFYSWVSYLNDLIVKNRVKFPNFTASYVYELMWKIVLVLYFIKSKRSDMLVLKIYNFVKIFLNFISLCSQ